MLEQETRINKIKQQLLKLGPFLPGSISTQWNVCGNPKCRCKDPKNPRKHGPYYQLSFSVAGKSSSMFIKKENLGRVKDCLKRYERFKELNKELILANVRWARESGLKNEKGKRK